MGWGNKKDNALRIVLFSFLGKACNAVYKYIACVQTLPIVVGRDGFEPSKSVTTDLQSAPFGHSGTSPYIGAGDWNRTHNLLITNQLLCLLSYASILLLVLICFFCGASGRNRTTDTGIFSPLLYRLSYRGKTKLTF